MLLQELNSLLEIIQSSRLRSLMCRGYKVFDSNLVFVEEWVDMVLIKEFGALCLRRDEVKEEACSDPRIERNPIAHVSESDIEYFEEAELTRQE